MNPEGKAYIQWQSNDAKIQMNQENPSPKRVGRIKLFCWKYLDVEGDRILTHFQ